MYSQSPKTTEYSSNGEWINYGTFEQQNTLRINKKNHCNKNKSAKKKKGKLFQLLEVRIMVTSGGRSRE